jgi:ferritin-like metal-binding protein YciE
VADLQARDVKLIQYLNEAYGKEKQLETALTAHIQMTTRPPYKKRLQQHLKETKTHARELKSRIRALGGKAEVVDVPGPEALGEAAARATELAQRAAAAAVGPLHALRGTGEQEKLLKNAKTEFQDEAEEIATYISIETLAEAVGDKETAKLARQIRREEERMRDYLGKLIPQLTKAVATEEIPAKERKTGRRRSTRRRSSAPASASKSSARKPASSRKSSARKPASSRKSSARKSSTSRSSARKPASRSSSSSRSSARSSSSRSTGRSSARKPASRASSSSRRSGSRKKS